jgi:hypothetical protein
MSAAALVVAAGYGDLAAVVALLAEGVNPNVYDEVGVRTDHAHPPPPLLSFLCTCSLRGVLFCDRPLLACPL